VSTRRRPFVRIEGRQRLGVIRGSTVAGAEIEAMNLSVSWKERVRPSDPVVIARADELGRFEGKLRVRPNDLVRVRARAPSGSLGKWKIFRVQGVSGTPRKPSIGVFRLGLRDLGNGSIKLFSLSPARPIAEPKVRLVVVNERTGDRIKIALNEVGLLKGRWKIGGSAGDVLRVETAKEPTRILGRLVTPSSKPPEASDVVRPSELHQKLGFVPSLRRFRAPLFARRPRPFDVYQSELGNCYLASAAAALAHVRPSTLARAIRPLGGGSYRIRFKTLRSRTGRYVARDVVVTSDLWVRPSGQLLYGSTAGLDEPPILWWPILEKAYARFKGSYKRIGLGGCSHHVLELLLGRPPRHFFLDSEEAKPEAVWREMTSALEARLPVVAGTWPPHRARKYRNTGLYPDHAYAVLSCREVGGVRRVGVRNPWGEDVRRPEKVRRNGCLEIDFDAFVELFQVVSTLR